MLDFRILYWLGQYQSSFLPTLALIVVPGKFAQPCRMSGEGLRLIIYCYGTNHPRTQWLNITKIIYFAHESAISGGLCSTQGLREQLDLGLENLLSRELTHLAEDLVLAVGWEPEGRRLRISDAQIFSAQCLQRLFRLPLMAWQLLSKSRCPKRPRET